MKITRRRLMLTLTAFLAIAAFGQWFADRPRALKVDEVPIAFWSWRTESPNAYDVRRALDAVNGKTLFLRAGQFDLVKGEPKRIRPMRGSVPAAGEIHLVYNATPDFLAVFEGIDPAAAARSINTAYRNDLSTAPATPYVRIRGLQLDLDIPTRLLPRYAELLKRVREVMPGDAQLSVTGLPTWTSSAELRTVLEAVDFWTPQCYGTELPVSLADRIPISSPADVKRAVATARRLPKPFYAGLAAYSYAILYDTRGRLTELRGDIDPAIAANHPALEQVRVDGFKDSPGEMRYEYRARYDTVLDGLVIRAGESVVFDVPGSASLRAAAGAVRENAGGSLLGICVFRIPTSGDRATLSLNEITAALFDREASPATTITVGDAAGKQVPFLLNNTGTAASMIGDGAMTVDLDLPAGSFGTLTDRSGQLSFQTLCRIAAAEPQPCSEKRANVLRLTARSWKPGDAASVTVAFTADAPTQIPTAVATRTADGRTELSSQIIQIKNRGVIE